MIIAALASATGKAGISVIRISGEDSIEATFDYLKVKNKNKVKGQFRYLHYGYFMDNDGAVVDQVTFVLFEKKHSYTGEESLEIFCHGSPLIVKKILAILYNDQRFREAYGGEFTEKRFLNGKIDLVQAEAVIDLINSESEMAHKSSLEQLEGVLSEELKEIKSKLLNLASHLELELDFADEDIDFTSRNVILARFDEALEFMKNFIASFKTGKKYREGIKVVLLGKVNAGKSSLMNQLLNTDRVIVTDVEGTTRDVIEETLEIEGFQVRLFDTAGIRETSDLVEKEGILRSTKLLKESDLIIHLVDIKDYDPKTKTFYDSDDYLVKKLKNIDSKKILNVINKIDKLYNNGKLANESKLIYISCKKRLGLNELKEKIVEYALEQDLSYKSSALTNMRHYQALVAAYESLLVAKESLINGADNAVIVMDIKNALGAMGEIVGETTDLDIINNIFKNFCIGK